MESVIELFIEYRSQVVWILVVILFFMYVYLKKCKFEGRVLYSIFLKLEKNMKIILSLLFLMAFIPGIWIYIEQFHLSWYQSVYYSLSQFMFDVKTPAEFGYGVEDIKSKFGNYHLIYYSAFIAALTSFLTVILVFFKDGIKNLHASQLAKCKDHIVICGLGENSRNLIKSILDAEETEQKIVVIEQSADNPYIKHFENRENIAFIIGSAAEEENLIKSGVLQCQYVEISTGNDIVNMTILSRIRKIEDDSYKKKGGEDNKEYVDVYVHLSRRDTEFFFDEQVFLGSEKARNTHFFSYNELAARKLFAEHPLIEGLDTVNSDDYVHICIIGFGDLGQEVALQAAMQGHFYNKQLLTISAVDPDPNNFDSFRANHWNIDAVCRFDTYVCSVDSLEFYEKYFAMHNYSLPTYIVFCLGDDMLTFSSLSRLVHRLKQKEKLEQMKLPNIAVRFKTNVAQSEELIETFNKSYNRHIFLFGASGKIATKENIVDDETDELARKMHEKYCEEESAKGNKVEDWDHLSNFLKDSNRAAADHRKIKEDTLHKLGLIKSNTNDLSDPKIQGLIDMEHRRWSAFHLLYGWEKFEGDPKADPKNKDKDKKLHACLVSTEELRKVGERLEGDPSYYDSNDLNNFVTIIEEMKK